MAEEVPAREVLPADGEAAPNQPAPVLEYRRKAEAEPRWIRRLEGEEFVIREVGTERVLWRFPVPDTLHERNMTLLFWGVAQLGVIAFAVARERFEWKEWGRLTAWGLPSYLAALTLIAVIQRLRRPVKRVRAEATGWSFMERPTFFDGWHVTDEKGQRLAKVVVGAARGFEGFQHHEYRIKSSDGRAYSLLLQAGVKPVQVGVKSPTTLLLRFKGSKDVLAWVTVTGAEAVLAFDESELLPDRRVMAAMMV